jgi:hypothetical protein
MPSGIIAILLARPADKGLPKQQRPCDVPVCWLGGGLRAGQLSQRPTQLDQPRGHGTSASAGSPCAVAFAGASRPQVVPQIGYGQHERTLEAERHSSPRPSSSLMRSARVDGSRPSSRTASSAGSANAHAKRLLEIEPTSAPNILTGHTLPHRARSREDYDARVGVGGILDFFRSYDRSYIQMATTRSDRRSAADKTTAVSTLTHSGRRGRVTSAGRAETEPTVGASEVWQARIGRDLAAQLRADAEVLGLDGRTDIVKAALQLLHRHAAEQRMAKSADDFYGDSIPPLPLGVLDGDDDGHSWAATRRGLGGPVS